MNWDMLRTYLPVFAYEVTEESRLQAAEIKLYEILTFTQQDLNGYSQPSRTTLFSLGI